MGRIFNFSAGPSILPDEVLEQAKEELMDWQGSGMSVMEMSHRGKEFVAIAEKAEADVRELLKIPSQYKVLFLQGGATSQFAMVPMNLLGGKKKADYIMTGSWSKKAVNEAKQYCQVSLAATSEPDGFTTIPAQNSWNLDPESAYLHYTTNETIGGVEFQEVPEAGSVPLVADMSSNILSRCIDVSQFGIIYAGAQKNMGPAGITLVIIREDLIGNVLPGTPSMFDYRQHEKAGSMLNTPPTYTWYLVGLIYEWLKRQGGIEAIETRNIKKAEQLYAVIDKSGFFSNPVDPNHRSRMNVPFLLADTTLESTFLAEAKDGRLAGLKGHRSVGGMRASIYNAMPEAGVDALIEMMSEFERKFG